MTPTEQQKTVVRSLIEDVQRKISEVMGTPVSLQFRIKQNHLHKNHLLQMVLGLYRITYSAFASKSREAEMAIPRQLYAYLAYKYCGTTTIEIAADINRERTTVYHCIQTVQDMIDTNNGDYVKPIQRLEEDIMTLLKQDL